MSQRLTPEMHKTAEIDDVEAIDALIEAAADSNARHHAGNTALHAAACGRRPGHRFATAHFGKSERHAGNGGSLGWSVASGGKNFVERIRWKGCRSRPSYVGLV